MKKRGEGGSFRPGVSLALAALVAAGALLGAWSYSSARVNNQAQVKVVESKNALIAVDVPETPVPIVQGGSGNCGTITNNMAETLDITVGGGFDCGFNYDDTLGPGESTTLEIEISPGEPAGTRPYPGKVFARWDGGSAEIGFEAYLKVIEPPEPEGLTSRTFGHATSGIPFPGGGKGEPCERQEPAASGETAAIAGDGGVEMPADNPSTAGRSSVKDEPSGPTGAPASDGSVNESSLSGNNPPDGADA